MGPLVGRGGGDEAVANRAKEAGSLVPTDASAVAGMYTVPAGEGTGCPESSKPSTADVDGPAHEGGSCVGDGGKHCETAL